MDDKPLPRSKQKKTKKKGESGLFNVKKIRCFSCNFTKKFELTTAIFSHRMPAGSLRCSRSSFPAPRHTPPALPPASSTPAARSHDSQRKRCHRRDPDTGNERLCLQAFHPEGGSGIPAGCAEGFGKDPQCGNGWPGYWHCGTS